MVTIEAHDPAGEATAMVGEGYTVRVLEPSPPAVAEPPFFADDPAAVGSPEPGTVTVTPHGGGDLTWEALVADRPDLTGFAEERWLGPRRRLPALPIGFAASRADFHRLAYSVVAEARRRANTKFGLRWTLGGFGTPFFGDDEQVRVVADQLVMQTGDAVRHETITTLAAAAGHVGVDLGDAAAEHDSPPIDEPDRRLDVSAESGTFLGEWFGFATAVLEDLRADAAIHDPERVQLWPGHFDPAIAAGDPGRDGRATFGFSPGDAGHPEPYVYVAPWAEIDGSDPYWNETAFTGASLPWAELASTSDQYARVRDFVWEGYQRLNR